MSHSLTIGIGSCLSVLLFHIIDSKVCSFWCIFLITSNGERKNETVVVERHLDFMCFSVQSLVMS